MKFRYISFVIAALVMSLLFVGSTSAAVTSQSMMLADSSTSALSTTTSTVNSSGDYITSSASLDTATSTATIGSDGYLCGDVGYNAIVKWFNVLGWNMWTYKSHFAVHVCHDSVRYVVALWDEPVNTFYGWSWCGNVTKWHSALPYSSARSYTKGCFTVLAQGIILTKYPWAKMTIGGNGGLWVRTTGIG